MVNQLPQGLVGDFQLLFLQAMALYLLLGQVALCNLQLFLSGVAGKLNNFHPVQERGRNGAAVVGSGDKEDLGKVIGNLQKVVPEAVVLLRVQHLQQGRGGVPPEVMAQLINFVQQQQGVGAPRLPDGPDNPPRHRGDIGFAVAPDIRFVPDASQGHPHIPAAHGFGDGAGNGGFPHAGRSHQTNDLPFNLRRKFAHRQGFQYPLLHLGEAVVLLVQKTPRLGNINFVLGADVPGEVQHRIQVGANHRPLLGAAGHLRELIQLLKELPLRFRRQVQGQNPLPVKVQLLVGAFRLPQLLGDYLHLLPQIILPLVLIHLLPDLLLDVLLQAENLVFLLQQADDSLHPLHDAGFFQNLLLFLIVQLDVAGDIFRKIKGILRIHHVQDQLPRHFGNQVAVLTEEVLGRPHQRPAVGTAGDAQPGGVILHNAGKEGLGLGDGEEAGPVLSFHQHPEGLRLDADDLTGLRHHPHLIKLLLSRIIGRKVLLGHQEDFPVAVDGLVEGQHRFFPPHVKVENHIGEEHQPPKSQHRHFLRQYQIRNLALGLLGAGRHFSSHFFLLIHMGTNHLSGPARDAAHPKKGGAYPAATGPVFCGAGSRLCRKPSSSVFAGPKHLRSGPLALHPTCPDSPCL